jgi:uncharacterized SAM-binding protein YcdF (DUF218 family)
VTDARTLRFRYFLLGLVGVPLLLVMPVLVTARLWLPDIGYWLAQPAQPGQTDAIVVLSGGGPERTLYGVALYEEQDLAPQKICFTDGQFARQFAIEQGVPAEAIHLLATTSTWEDGEEIAALAKRASMQSVLVVTDWYHSRRALCVIQYHLADSGVTVYYDPPPALTYGPDDWWQSEDGLVAVINELIKFGFYWWQYGLVPWHC